MSSKLRDLSSFKCNAAVSAPWLHAADPPLFALTPSYSRTILHHTARPVTKVGKHDLINEHDHHRFHPSSFAARYTWILLPPPPPLLYAHVRRDRDSISMMSACNSIVDRQRAWPRQRTTLDRPSSINHLDDPGGKRDGWMDISVWQACNYPLSSSLSWTASKRGCCCFHKAKESRSSSLVANFPPLDSAYAVNGRFPDGVRG